MSGRTRAVRLRYTRLLQLANGAPQCTATWNLRWDLSWKQDLGRCGYLRPGHTQYRWALSPGGCVLISRGDTRGRRPCEDGGRACRDPATGQGGAGTDAPSETPGTHPRLPTPWSWTSGLTRERVHPVVVSRPVCDGLHGRPGCGPAPRRTRHTFLQP